MLLSLLLKEYIASNPTTTTFEDVINTRTGFYLFGRFCKTNGADAYVKWQAVEDFVKLNGARSQTSLLAVANDILNNYLDDSAFAPGPRIPLDHGMAFKFEPVLVAADATGIYDVGAQNPLKFDLSCSAFTEAQNALIKASGKKKKENPIKLEVFVKIVRAVAQYLKVSIILLFVFCFCF